LQNEKAIVVQINPFGVEKGGNLLERRRLAIQLVGGRIVLVGDPRDNRFRLGHNGIILVAISRVDYFLKVDRDAGIRGGMVFDGIAFVNQLGNFVEPEFFGPLSKDKEHGINDIGFPGAVGSDDGGKAFVEGTNLFDARVGFEIL
jgi:hypothetical protein